MKIILTGGGTGGHITPLLAVAHHLKKQDPNCHIIYIGERNGKYASLTKDNTDIDEVRSIFAGKFRRYHRESWFVRLFAVKTNLLNLRDFVYFIIGTLQSIVLVKSINPDVILLKGGFVGVPIGIGAALWRKPFITHDSDTMPGLANRLVGKWAELHATGMPPEYYQYDPKKIRYVGVLVGEKYEFISTEKQIEYKKELEIPPNHLMLLITGGSGGAHAINLAVRSILEELLTTYPELTVIHQVGIGKGNIYDDFTHPRLRVYEMLKPMYMYTGASDVVITRAGANTMAELGVQSKACIVIPNPYLTGGHQLKNAEVLISEKAAKIVDESVIKHEPSQLLKAVKELFDDPEARFALSTRLHKLTVKDAASKLAELLLGRDKDLSG